MSNEIIALCIIEIDLKYKSSEILAAWAEQIFSSKNDK